MCVVSNISDTYRDTFPQRWPQFVPLTAPQIGGASQYEVDALRREVEELKKLLQAAKRFDDNTGQPHCEKDEKVKLIKDVAKMVGVDLGDALA